ncbi:MAG: hypothetical protein HC878_00280 [Leptolyngbyaceae cyanobacterium SL_5_14]|nr:hypothetical protein [Leptolyngbyaceae cyanobacterium SL_5_14]
MKQFIDRLRVAIAIESKEAQTLQATIGMLKAEIEKLKAALSDSQVDASECDAILEEMESIVFTPVLNELIGYVEEEPEILTPPQVAAEHGNVAHDYIPPWGVGDASVSAIASLLESNPVGVVGEVAEGF